MWSNYEGTEAKLYQIQMTHGARPSALFNVRDGFNDFLKMAQDGDSAPPASLELLQSQAGVKLVLTDRNDPDEVGFIQWRRVSSHVFHASVVVVMRVCFCLGICTLRVLCRRAAFYVAGADGCVKNFMCLFDEWIAWKSKQMAKEIEVNIHQRQGEAEVDSEFVDGLTYEHYTFHEPAEAGEALPLLWKECQPCIGKRVVTLHLQIESNTHLSALWSGNTWQFRQRLDEAGVKGAYIEAEGQEDKRTYFRIMKSLDASEGIEKLTGVLTNVFRNMAMRAVVEGELADDSHTAEFVAELKKEAANLHFD